jgi:hypothetical protein
MEISKERLPIEGLEYPQSFMKAIELNLVDFDLWYMMDEGQVLRRIEGLKQRYPNRKLIPFARRDDNDDIACFEIGKGEKVQIVHDFASEGYEQRKEFEDFWQWLEEAVHEMIEYNK